MTIVALFTICSGAAVLTFARYADSDAGTSADGYWGVILPAQPLARTAVTTIAPRHPSRIFERIARPPLVILAFTIASASLARCERRTSFGAAPRLLRS